MRTIQLIVTIIFFSHFVSGREFSSYMYDGEPEKDDRKLVGKDAMSFHKEDSLVMTHIMFNDSNYSEPIAYTQILMSPEATKFSFHVAKNETKLTTEKLIEALEFVKIKGNVESRPIDLFVRQIEFAAYYREPYLRTITIYPKNGLGTRSYFVEDLFIGGLQFFTGF